MRTYTKVNPIPPVLHLPMKFRGKFVEPLAIGIPRSLLGAIKAFGYEKTYRYFVNGYVDAMRSRARARLVQQTARKRKP